MQTKSTICTRASALSTKCDTSLPLKKEAKLEDSKIIKNGHSEENGSIMEAHKSAVTISSFFYAQVYDLLKSCYSNL